MNRHPSCPPCTGDCHSGRDCLHSTNATRAVFGLPPLHETDGGHVVSGQIVMPLTVDRDEEMPARFRTRPPVRDLFLVRVALVVTVAMVTALALVQHWIA